MFIEFHLSESSEKVQNLSHYYWFMMRPKAERLCESSFLTLFRTKSQRKSETSAIILFLIFHSIESSEKDRNPCHYFWFNTTDNWEIMRKLSHYFWFLMRLEAQLFHSPERLCENSDTIFNFNAQRYSEISAISFDFILF